jgi:hypothetical protein
MRFRIEALKGRTPGASAQHASLALPGLCSFDLQHERPRALIAGIAARPGARLFGGSAEHLGPMDLGLGVAPSELSVDTARPITLGAAPRVLVIC